MDEAARIKRNSDRITECFPAFGERIRAVLDTMEAQQFRPRIQEAHATAYHLLCELVSVESARRAALAQA